MIALSQSLHAGIDYLMSLPVDELSELAKEVTAAYGKFKSIRAGNKNRW